MAEEAERIGLVNRLVDDEKVLDAAEDLAAQIARQGGTGGAPGEDRAQHVEPRRAPDRNALVEQLAQAVLFESQDKLDRMGAFLESKEKRRREKEQKSQ